MIYVLLHCCIVQPTATQRQPTVQPVLLLNGLHCGQGTPYSPQLESTIPLPETNAFYLKIKGISNVKKEKKSASTFWVRYSLKWYIPLAKHSLGGIKEFPMLKGLFLRCIWARAIDHRCALTLMSNWSRKRATFKAFLTGR